MIRPITFVYSSDGYLYANGVHVSPFPCAYARRFLFGRVVRKQATKTYWLSRRRKPGAVRLSFAEGMDINNTVTTVSVILRQGRQRLFYVLSLPDADLLGVRGLAGDFFLVPA